MYISNYDRVGAANTSQSLFALMHVLDSLELIITYEYQTNSTHIKKKAHNSVPHDWITHLF